MKTHKLLSILLLLVCLFNCSKNDDNSDTNNDNNDDPEPELSENVKLYNPDLVADNLVFNMRGQNACLINKVGDTLKNWDFGYELGNDAKILPNTNIIGMFRADSPTFSFGGYGGVVRLFDFEGNELWNYEYANEDHLSHHDVLHLDNGNVMFQAWERVPPSEASALGINTTTDIYTESLIEVNPTTNQIVWEWHSKDHSVQDVFPAVTSTYGTVSDNPQLININYNLEGGNGTVSETGNVMHCNGIFHDSEKDVIYLSIYMYSEVWVIDHSTSTSEAASHTGGNYNKGGDLLYRFGNPTAYNNSEGERLFYRTHTPNIIKDNYPGAGNFLIFMNGYDETQGSIIYEFEVPNTFDLVPNQDNEPLIVWSFEEEDLFYGRISGAQRLSNGNTLICEGDYGFWEVTSDGEIAWKYSTEGSFWRAYAYDFNDPAISPLEQN